MPSAFIAIGKAAGKLDLAGASPSPHGFEEKR
jgi:hypothetical protein